MQNVIVINKKKKERDEFKIEDLMDDDALQYQELSKDERVRIFWKLLKDKHITSDSKWDNSIRNLAQDPRWKVIL